MGAKYRIFNISEIFGYVMCHMMCHVMCYDFQHLHLFGYEMHLENETIIFFLYGILPLLYVTFDFYKYNVQEYIIIKGVINILR